MMIATVIKVEGNVFVKKIDGTILKVASGDVVETGDILFGADDKAAYTIEYVDNAGTMTFAGIAPQLFDPTMIPTGVDGAETALVATADANPFAQSILTPEELAALIGDGKEDKDLETASGQDHVKESETQSDSFAARTGAQTDVNSGLRNAQFISSTAREDEQEVFKREDSGSLNPIHPTEPVFPPPVVLPPIITPPPPILPPITPPPLRGTLELSGDVSINEGGIAQYKLTVSEAPKTPLTVTIQIGHITTENGDLIPRTMTVTIPAGAKTVTFPISNNPDDIYEGAENYQVHIVSTSGGDYNQLTIGKDTVTTTIVDAQPIPTLTINDQTINEQEGTMTFTVTLSGKTEANVTFDYASANGSATSGMDYNAVSGTKTILAGLTSITITIPIYDDFMSDNNETFNLVLSNPSSNAVIADGTGVGRILDDTGTPNTPSDGPELTHESVIIKLVALDSAETPVLDGNGHYTFANSVNEGSDAKYMALAFAPNESVFSPATKLSTQVGSVNITLHDGSATGAGSQSAIDGSQDFNNTPQTVTLGVAFVVNTFDENTPDNGETFTVTMVGGSYTPSSGGYENVAIDTAVVTTTIIDLLNLTPDDATVVEGGVTITESSAGMANLFTNDIRPIGSVITTFTYHDESGTLQSASAGTSVNTQYGQLQINSDGTWSYTSDGNEVHPVGNSLSDLATYTVSDGTNTQTENFTITVTDTIATLSPVSATLDEDDIAAIGSDGAQPSFIIQSLGITKGSDTINSIVFDTAGTMPTLTSGGVAVTYSYSNGNSLLTATANGVSVFTVQLTLDGTNANNSDYTFTLLKPLDHVSANGQNSLDFTLPIKINETDDVISSSLSLSVVDDVPTAVADTNAITEDAMLNTAIGNVITIGAGADTVGADGAVVDGVRIAGADLTTAVSSGVNATINGLYGTVNINAAGVYTYTLNNTNLTVQGLTTNEHLTDTFVYSIKDADGDVSTTTLSIQIDGADDGVTVTAPENYTGASGVNTDHVVYESGLATGSSPSVANIGVVSTFTIQALDGLGSVVIAGTTLTAAQIQALDSSHTQTILTTYGSMVLNSYSIAANGTITIGYTYTLTSAPHISGTDTMDNILITAYDTDGTPDSGADTLSIKIVDDAPVAVNDTRNINEGANSITGNVVTGTTNGDQADHGNADGLIASPVVKVMYGATEIVLGTRTDVTDGYITINADGSYTYEAKSGLNNPAGADLIENFIYTIRDADGDETNGTLRVNVKDLDATISGSTASIDEDDLASGSDTTGPTSVLGTLTVTPATDAFDVQFDATGYPSGLKSGGVALVYTISPDGHTLTATAGVSGATIFTAVLSDATTTTPDYTFTLNGPLDHADAADQNILAVTPKVKVVEFDGTVATTTFTVNVTDDVPTAAPDAEVSVVEGNTLIISDGATNLLTNDTLGADGAKVFKFDYTNESGSPATATVGITPDINGLNYADANTQYGSIRVYEDGSWKYTSDPNENQTTATKDTITYYIKDFDGDISWSTKVFNVTDNPDTAQFGTVVDTVVNESGLNDGNEAISGAITISHTGSVYDTFDITFASDAIATLEALNLTSGGVEPTYALSNSGHTLTATVGGQTVFTSVINNPTSISSGYTFTLYKPLDHLSSAGEPGSTNPYVAGEDYNLPFKISVIEVDGKTASDTFFVDVKDSVPSAVDIPVTLAEDNTGTIIRLGNDAFQNGNVTINGHVLANGDNTDVYDPNNSASVIGNVVNNGNGTVTFTPVGNYSNNSASPTFSYDVTDSDGDHANKNVILTITPVTDTPTWTAHSGVSTDEDTLHALDLVLPTITDNTDQNAGATGDHAERLGYITLESIDAGAKIYNGGAAITDGTQTSITIAIVDGSGNLDTTVHYTDLDPNAAGVIKLTAAEFAALQILPATNRHEDIDMTLKVTSYEVDDSGNKLSAYTGSEATLPVHVEVLAVTDPITLLYNQQGTEADGNPATYTHTAINEGAVAINIGAILDATAVNGDLDGSEIRSYTVSGIPAGTIVTIGGVVGTASAGGTVTILFPDNTVQDPTFTMKFPDQFGGQVNATITLNVHDTDSDSTTTPATNTASVTFDVYVTPVADAVSVAVNQVEGLEDAGRTVIIDPLTGLVTSTTINSANGLPLVINVSSDDKDGSETYNVTIADIPTGSSLYYNGVEQVISLGSTTITNFSNSASLKLIPPLNNNADFVLSVTAQSVEIDNGAVTNSAPIELKVFLTGVADEMVHDGLNDVTASNGVHYSSVMTETAMASLGVSIRDNFATSATLGSYDGTDLTNDVQEKVSVIITGLDAAFDVSGVTLIGGTGTARVWSMTLDAFKTLNPTITGPAHYAGEVAYTVKMITNENDGASHTDTYALKTLVTPVSEGTLTNASAVVTEDTLTHLSAQLATNGDTNESITDVWILKSDVDGQPFDLYIGNSTTTLLISVATVENLSGIDYYKLTPVQFDAIYAQFGSQVGHAAVENINVKYTTTDPSLVAGIAPDSVVHDMTYTLTNAPVTDPLHVSFDSDPSHNILAVTVDETNRTGITETITFSSVDEWSGTGAAVPVAVLETTNEHITKLVITGVPDGVSIVGATYIGHTTDSTPSDGEAGVSTNIWVFDKSTTDLATLFTGGSADLDSDGAQFPITFVVGGAFTSPADYNIVISAHSEDPGASEAIGTATLTLHIPILAPISEEPLDIITFNELGYTGIEDASFNLASVIDSHVLKDGIGGADGITDIGNFAITVQNIVNGFVVSGATNSTEYPTIYSYAGIVDINNPDVAIDAALAAIQLQPTAHYNSNFGGAMSYDVVLTTYTNSGVAQSKTLHFDTAVTPVTDGVITANEVFTYINVDATTSAAKEDGSVGIAINLTATNHDLSSATDGSVDHAWAVASGDITLTHTGIAGRLSWNGGVNFVDLDGTTADTAIVPQSALGNLTFTPLTNASGLVTFTYSITTTETGASNSVSSPQSFTFDVKPVVDGLNVNSNIQAAVGTEDVMLELKLPDNGGNLRTIPQLWIDNDGSESLKVFAISHVPDGFQIFYGASGSQVMALNMGGGIWNIPVSGSTPPDVWLNPLKNYSGIVTGMELDMQIQDVSSTTTVQGTQTVVFDAVFTPVADAITMNPTLTFGTEGSRVPVNVNITMDDFDGSEKITLTLTNSVFVAGALNFQTGAGFIDLGGRQSFDSATHTYTLTGLTKDEVNTLSVVPAEGGKGSFTVDMTATNTDTGALLSVTGSTVTGQFNLTLTSHASGVKPFTPSVANNVDVAISGRTVVGLGYIIPLTLAGLDLKDKITDIGEEQLTIRLSGLTSALSVDASTVTGATVTMDGADTLITLPKASDSNYAQSLSDIAAGHLHLVSTATSGNVDSINVSAYSTDLTTHDVSTPSTPQTLPLNLTVDASGTIDGTANNDWIVGTSGDDVIDGGLGADKIEGGLGNDTILFHGTESSVDGGGGIDTLQMSTSINFSGLSTVITNIEKIDLTPAGNQTISGLSLDKIFTMTDSSSTHTLTIDGNAGDAVSAVTKTGWTKDSEATTGGYTSYTYHNDSTTSNTVTVKIDTDLTNTTNLA